MQLDITGHNIDITDALRQRLQETLQRVDQHTGIPIQHTHVVLNIVNKKAHRCDIQMTVGANVFCARDEAEDMYIAINQTVHKLERQMEKAKKQTLTRRHTARGENGQTDL